jgi:hypothetical protein
MANTAVMTLRLEPELLAELKARARTEGRSTSAEVIHLIERVIRVPKARTSARLTMGMFAHLDAPELADFQSDGRIIARVFEESIASSIKRYHGSESRLDTAVTNPRLRQAKSR